MNSVAWRSMGCSRTRRCSIWISRATSPPPIRIRDGVHECDEQAQSCPLPACGRCERFALQQLEQSLAVSQLDAGFRAHTLMTRARILMDLNRLVAAEADRNEALNSWIRTGCPNPPEKPRSADSSRSSACAPVVPTRRGCALLARGAQVPLIGDSPPRGPRGPSRAAALHEVRPTSI